MAPTLVLLHGFTHTGASWDAVIGELGQRYRPLAPDIRGHGTASDLVPVDLEHVIEDIAALGGARFTLVGYSMGGRIALHAAFALTSWIDRLILIGASPGIADPGERASRRASDEQLAAELESSDIETFARSWARTPVLADQPPAVVAGIHEDRLRNTPAGLARALRGLGTGALPSLWDRLPTLTIPTTLIVGARDCKFRSTATQMAHATGSARVVEVPAAGHAVHLEAPEHVARLI